MTPFAPNPVSCELIDPIDEHWVRVITWFPGQKICARIERRAMDEFNPCIRVPDPEWKEV